MFDRLRNCKFSEMLKENGEWSFTRIIALTGYLAFLIGSAYLMYNNIHWSDYDTFAQLTGGGGMATQLVNKLMNSKYNTEAGQSGKPEPETQKINRDKYSSKAKNLEEK